MAAPYPRSTPRRRPATPAGPAQPLRPARRAWLARAAAAIGAGALLAGLPGCAGLGGAQNLRFSETELALMLARQFPLERKVLDVLLLQLANPRLTLLPARNRVVTAFDIRADDRLFGKHASGHVTLDCALRFEAGDHSLRLKDVTVEELSLASDANTLRGQAQRLGVLAAEHLLEDMAIYRMKPEQAERMDRLGLEARQIAVTDRGVEIVIAPKAR